MPIRTLLLRFYLQSILFHQLDFKEWNLIPNLALNATQNCDKHYKKSRQSDKIDKDNFKYAKLSLRKINNNKKKLYFEEKTAEKEEQS